MTDPRRSVPRTDDVLADPMIVAACRQLGPDIVRTVVHATQHRVRQGDVAPEDTIDVVVASLPASGTTLRPVINATGVVVHTNLGRAPLSISATDALVRAAGYVDVEFDLHDGVRARRGLGLLEALRAAVPDADDVLAVNNGAAALVLATTALGAGREMVISRGEMVEIGDGFRLPELIESTGTRLREVGTTNRVTVDDYRGAISEHTAAILKVHPSNFRVDGFASSVPIAQLADIGVPVVADIGSGLLSPDRLLPQEPDARTTLRAGATLVTCSCDKLLGGPQAGLVLGSRDVVDRLRRHPLARAMRIDKTTVAALEATVRAGHSPVQTYLRVDTEIRTRRLAARFGLDVVRSTGAIGGGGGAGVELPGWALALPEQACASLRTGDPAIVARIERKRCLIDLRCVPPADDELVATALAAALT